MPLPDELRLKHMLDATRLALEHVAGKSRQDLDASQLLVAALTHWIQVIGEAARNVSAETRDRAPRIPWNQIVGAST